MKKLSIIIILLVAGLCVNVYAENPKFDGPKLGSVELVDEFTLKLKWSKVENAKNLTRFRIFYIKNDEDKFLEWPAQITRTKKEAVQTRDYVSFSFDNAFDCYKDCIKNPVCTFAIYKSITDRLSGENCFLKTGEKKPINTTSNLFDENYEFVRIAGYSNEAILKGISTTDNYSFSVFVYDATLDGWSSESNNAEFKGQKFDIALEYDTKSSKSIKLSWKKNTKFTVSRYNVILSSSDKSNNQLIPVLNELSKFKFDPNYYETITIEESAACESEEDCFKKCANMSDCVRYMHEKESKMCKLYKKFDSTAGRLVPINAVAYSVKSDAKEFTLKKKLVNKSGNYTIKIEFIDSFGVARYSNSINVTINRSDDGEDEIEEKTTTTTTVKSITAEKPIETIDYPDENENETIEYQTETDEFPNKITTPNSIIETDDGELTLNQNSTQILKVNDQFSVSCSWSGSPKTKLVWTKKDDSSRQLSIKKTSYDHGSTYELAFSKLSREDEGIYTCSLDDNVDTYLNFNLMVKDVPSKPNIKNASLSKKGLFIEWTLENTGGADLTKAIIELSPDFDNQSITVQEVAFVGASLKQNQAIINGSIDAESKLRITVENIIGLSEISDISPIKCLENNCTDLAGPQTVVKQKGFKRQSLIYVLIIAGILAIALLIYAVFECRKRKPKSEPNNEDNHPFINK